MIFAAYQQPTGERIARHFDTWNEFNTETFSPDCDVTFCWDYKVHGKTYKERKGFLRDMAIDFSVASAEFGFSWWEIAEIQEEFERVGKKYGLLREFRENGII